MRAIITGGAGFIGSALAHRLVARGDEVLVLDKLTYAGNAASLADLRAAANFHFVEADICDADAVAKSFDAFRPDTLLHLAAESHVDRSITDAGAFVETNVVGTYRLLDAARAYCDAVKPARFRFVHVSTDEVFGALGPEGAFDETSPYDPRSPYSASKAASDHLVRAWGHTYGLPVLISNCTNNYGPRQLPEKLIPLMILNGLQGRALPVYGDGRQVRDWIHVDDHVDALVRVAEQGASGHTYLIGAGAEQENISVVRAICDLLDELAPAARSRHDLITHVEDRPGHDRRYAINPQRAQTELGWRPRTTFRDGLRRTVQWYLDNEAWWGPLRARGHGAQRLGLIDPAPARDGKRR